jgi:glycosyltransferase involved in cell wall biosynthesis
MKTDNANNVIDKRSCSVLLVTNSIHKSPMGGREMLCRLNYDALRTLYGSRLYVYQLQRFRLHSLNHHFSALRGYIDGVDAESIRDICALVRQKDIQDVFVDGSNLGAVVQALKQSSNKVVVTTFFHNVEARFFWGSLTATKSLRALLIFAVNLIAERKATRLSDKRICLSERDSNLLSRLYGKGATHIAPLAIEDRLSSLSLNSSLTHITAREPFILFVGGSFYANRDGIAWFVQNVVPYISIKVCIVGNNMEVMRAKLEIPGRVEVIGTVDNLSDWYLRASFVIAPIFDGSGMKTKVAEALMYGKKVVGTPEAFSGYEQVAARAGWCCSSSTEFVIAINSASATITSSFDTELRALYDEYFSLPAATARLADVLASTKNS